MAIIKQDYGTIGGGNLEPTLIDSGYSNPNTTTITVANNMTNAMVIITYSAGSVSYIPSEAQLDAKVTLPATADNTIFFTGGHMAQKIYYFKNLNAGDQIIAQPYNATYGYDYIELIQL